VANGNFIAYAEYVSTSQAVSIEEKEIRSNSSLRSFVHTMINFLNVTHGPNIYFQRCVGDWTQAVLKKGPHSVGYNFTTDKAGPYL
jgi:hypothetical protein